jgi:LEA14-like dessication related protein
MITRFKWPATFIFLLLVLSSCGKIVAPEFRKIDNVRVDRIAGDQSSLLLDLYYYNPNNTRLQLKEAEGDAWINDSFLGHFTVDSAVSIPANADFRIPAILTVDMKKLLKNAGIMLAQKEVPIRLEGKAKVGKAGIFIKYPIKYEGTQDISKLIGF